MMLMNRSQSAFRRTSLAPRLPVLLSVPHAGRAYTAGLLRLARLPASVLALLEDPFVDRLIDGGIAAGAAAIVADVPRAEIDLNRALDDLDPAMVAGAPAVANIVSVRAGAGLGLIPSRLAGHGALWHRPLAPADVHRRIAAVYEPYHEALSGTLAVLRDGFGVAILLDCHSMPPRGGLGAQVVLGDRSGATCAEWLVAATESACAAEGLTTMRNDPYAGGEIVQRHGAPDRNIHALQIELDRDLYMAPNARPDAVGAQRMSRLIETIVTAVSQSAASAALPLAAE